MTRHRLWRALRSERGANTVELTLYAPYLFLTVFLVVQAALWWHGNQIASAIARDVARHARAESTAKNEAQIEAWGRTRAEQVSGKGLDVTRVDVEFVGDDVRVTVKGGPLAIIEEVTPSVTQTVQGPLEEFKPDL